MNLGMKLTAIVTAAALTFGCANTPVVVYMSPDYDNELSQLKDKHGCHIFTKDDVSLLQQEQIPVSFVRNLVNIRDVHGNMTLVRQLQVLDAHGNPTGQLRTHPNGCPAYDAKLIIEDYKRTQNR